MYEQPEQPLINKTQPKVMLWRILRRLLRSRCRLLVTRLTEATVSQPLVN
jgi:hypothetical protein